MSVKGGPDLRRYMDKKLALRLNAGRRVTGVLRGFDQFMNLVLDETIEEVSASERNEIGMVVIRGNSVTMMICTLSPSRRSLRPERLPPLGSKKKR